MRLPLTAWTPFERSRIVARSVRTCPLLRGTTGHRCEGWCGPHVRRHLEVLGGASRCLDTLREACPIPVGAWPATRAAVAGRDPLRANDVEQRYSQHRRESNPNN